MKEQKKDLIFLNIDTERTFFTRKENILACKTSKKYQFTVLHYRLGKKIKKVLVKETPQEIYEKLIGTQGVPKPQTKNVDLAMGTQSVPKPQTNESPNKTNVKNFIFVDESGDLGWQINPEDGEKGSSPYFCLSLIAFHGKSLRKKINTFLDDLNVLFNRSKGKELKWSSFNNNQKETVKTKLLAFVKANPGIVMSTLVMKKTAKEAKKYQGKEGQVYADMLKSIFPKEFIKGNTVMAIDRNSIVEKVRKSLLTELKSIKNNQDFSIHLEDSQRNRALQLSDLLAGIVADKHKKGERKKLASEITEAKFSA